MSQGVAEQNWTTGAGANRCGTTESTGAPRQEAGDGVLPDGHAQVCFPTAGASSRVRGSPAIRITQAAAVFRDRGYRRGARGDSCRVSGDM
jgi:hypothetical protein